MNPSVEQLERWAQRDGDGWVRLPESAWDGVLWLLTGMEKIEEKVGSIPWVADLFKERSS